MIDLHTHSVISDGSEPPERIPELAAAAGCSAVALTDHDSVDGLQAAQSAADRVGITLVRGCEISCSAKGVGAMHVLVYFIDADDGPLLEELVRLRQDRQDRNRAVVAKLAELGVSIDYDRLIAEAGNHQNLGRPHLARALVEVGAAADADDAFDRWLAEGRPAYVPKGRIGPDSVAALARESGAVAVLAHPLSLRTERHQLSAVIRELAGLGFAGIEAFYGRYRPHQRQLLRSMAQQNGLVATGGSDFHGDFKPDLAVGTGQGDLKVPDRVLEALAARRPRP